MVVSMESKFIADVLYTQFLRGCQECMGAGTTPPAFDPDEFSAKIMRDMFKEMYGFELTLTEAQAVSDDLIAVHFNDGCSLYHKVVGPTLKVVH